MMRPASSPLLGLFALAMINVAAIASLRDLPQMAKNGTGCVFFYSHSLGQYGYVGSGGFGDPGGIGLHYNRIFPAHPVGKPGYSGD